MNSLLLVFLVSVGDGFGQLFQLFAVVELDLGPSPEDILELCYDSLLDLQTTVQALELIVQLYSNVWKRKKENHC